MKTVAVSKVDAKLNAVVGTSQKERVVLTRGGKPSAVLIGIENYDAEDQAYATSAEFWRLIESRRQGRTVPLAELKTRLGHDNAGRHSPKMPITEGRTPRAG